MSEAFYWAHFESKFPTLDDPKVHDEQKVIKLPSNFKELFSMEVDVVRAQLTTAGVKMKSY